MKTTLSARGFTLIETLVAVTLLTLAIGAPMALTSKSLAAAYRARDQITAFHLAQEAIETVRHVRDHNILMIAVGEDVDLLDGILTEDDDSQVFTVDTTESIENAIDLNGCPSGECPPLQINSDDELYGYGTGWRDTRFTRTVSAETIREEDGVPQEVKITAAVSWQTGSFEVQTVEISENLYRWVSDNTQEDD